VTKLADIVCHKCGCSAQDNGSWLRLIKGMDQWECARPCDAELLTNEEKLLGAIEDDE